MALALDDAQLATVQFCYFNAHGTATAKGDVAESRATAEILGTHVPISSLKSYVGHTLGACGALEAWISLEMMREGWFAPTLNLDQVRSEEHTSELQSRGHLVCRLLLEKKKYN